MAYDAPGYGSSVSDSTPAVGSAVTVRVTGVDPGATVTLKTSDGQTLTATANASGVATFKVTFEAAGNFTAQAFVNGALVSDQVLTVSAARAGAAELGQTGFDAAGFAVGGGLLVLVGAGAVVLVKRRQSTKASA